MRSEAGPGALGGDEDGLDPHAMSALRGLGLRGNARAVAMLMLLRIEHEGAYGKLLAGAAGERGRLDADPESLELGPAEEGPGGPRASSPGEVSAAELFGRLDARDRRQVTEMVQGVTRQRLRLQWAVEQLSGRARDASQPVPWLALMMCLYEMDHMRKPAYILNDYMEIVKRAGERHMAGFVNAVIRKVDREGRVPRPELLDGYEDLPEADLARALAVVGSHPEWMVRRWVRRFGVEDTVELMEANNERPSFTLRANAAAGVTGAKLLAALAKVGAVDAVPCAFLPDDFVRVKSGLGAVLGAGMVSGGICSVQDEGAGLVVAMLDPRPGDLVLDLCAAPGGKATYAMHRMRGRGTLVACDANRNRLTLVAKAAQEQGLKGMLVTAPLSAEDVGAHWNGPPAGGYTGERGGALSVAELQDKLKIRLGRASARGAVLFDRVLVDAPCSGLGVLGKRADLRWQRTEEEVGTAVEMQESILDAAAATVKPGGLLVYSTCSIEREENHEQVARFLRAHPEFQLESGEGLVSPDVLDELGLLCVYPHTHGTDGAFAARLRRRA